MQPNSLLRQKCVNNGGLHIIITAVYAYNLASQRRTLWHDLARTSATYDLPWLIFGDFNSVRLREEKANGRQLHTNVLSSFNTLIAEANLFEPPTVGNVYFTWHNEQRKEKRIACKLDRALINETFLEKFPQTHVRTEAPGKSDHAPLVVSVMEKKMKRRPFRFLNC